MAEAGRLGIQHFQALEYLLNSAERLDRLQTMLGQWMLTNLNSSHGTWDNEQQDLVDFAALLEFLAKCHQRPTDLESENLLLLAD